jgi:hypothetical protein
VSFHLEHKHLSSEGWESSKMKVLTQMHDHSEKSLTFFWEIALLKWARKSTRRLGWNCHFLETLWHVWAQVFLNLWSFLWECYGC